MNVCQRRFLVASLRFLSVVVAGSCLAIVATDWYLSAEAPTADPRISALSLSGLLLAAIAALWLARFVTLGEDARPPSVDLASKPPPRRMGQDCPTWPTILSWLVTDLDDEKAQRVSTHVSACDNCRKRLALMNAVQEMASDRGR